MPFLWRTWALGLSAFSDGLAEVAFGVPLDSTWFNITHGGRGKSTSNVYSWDFDNGISKTSNPNRHRSHNSANGYVLVVGGWVTILGSPKKKDYDYQVGATSPTNWSRFSSYLTQSRTKKIPPVSMPLNQSCRLQEFQRKRMKKIQSNDSDVNWCGTRVSEVSLLLWPFSTELLTSWNPSTQRSHNGGRSSGLCSDAVMSCLSILFCLMCKVRQSEGLHIAASGTAIYAVLATSHLQYESVHKLTSRISNGKKPMKIWGISIYHGSEIRTLRQQLFVLLLCLSPTLYFRN